MCTQCSQAGPLLPGLCAPVYAGLLAQTWALESRRRLLPDPPLPVWGASPRTPMTGQCCCGSPLCPPGGGGGAVRRRRLETRPHLSPRVSAFLVCGLCSERLAPCLGGRWSPQRPEGSPGLVCGLVTGTRGGRLSQGFSLLFRVLFFFFFGNSFAEREFTCYSIQLLKAPSSGALRASAGSCGCHHSPFPGFSPPAKEAGAVSRPSRRHPGCVPGLGPQERPLAAAACTQCGVFEVQLP